jgi:hypothetical protein
MLRTIKTLTFVYIPREDRIMTAINAGHAEAWSCWLTRRLALAVLDRASGYLTSTSQLAQRAPAELRGELTAFEREAGIAKTAGAMSVTPPAVLKQSETVAELADRLMIAQHGDGFRLELRGQGEEGAAGLFKRAELQRVLEMLQVEVNKAGWMVVPAPPQAPAPPAPGDTKPSRH